MKSTHIGAVVLMGLVSAAGGWFASELKNMNNLTPAESIYAAWQSQLTAMTNQAGELRAPEDAVAAGAASLSALSIGLAIHYDQLTEEEKIELQRFLPRAKVVPLSQEGRNYQAVISCIEAAGKGSVDQQCLTKALANG